MDEADAVNVLLVDDQELVRSGLRRILRRRSGFEIVAECADGAEVPAALAEHEVDVVRDGPADEARRRHRGDPAPARGPPTRRRCWC